MVSYNKKSYIQTNKTDNKCDLIPIVIDKETKSYKLFKEALVKGVSLDNCKFETIDTFIAKGNYFDNEKEFIKEKVTKKETKEK